MNDFYVQAEARELLEDFENAFQDAWFVAQDILEYIKKEYNGDRDAFLNDVAQNCDYCSSAEALKSVFGISEK